MNADSAIHVGDVGTSFKFTIKDGTSVVDISGATLIQIILDKPNKTQSVQTGQLDTDGTDGVIKWTTTSTNDLNVAGWWIAQAYIEIGVNHWHSSTVRFRVLPNL